MYLAKHRPSGYICALKVLDKRQIRKEGSESHVRREVEIHSRLKHPNVLRFFNWFHDKDRIILALEYSPGGELYRSLQKRGRFDEKTAARYVAQMALALQYLHRKNVMHRDIKPENILLGLHGELKLADFGYSVHSPSDRRATMCGTLDYLPPEMLKARKSEAHYSKSIDLWSLGVLTYEFLVGEAPFEDTPVMTYRRIARKEMTIPSFVSSEAKGFIHSVRKT